MLEFFANYGLIAAYILLAIATLGSLFVATSDLIRSPESGKSTLTGIIIFIVILAVSFAFSSSEALPGLSEDVSKTYYIITGTGLIALYIVGGLAVLGMLVSEIISYIKNI